MRSYGDRLVVSGWEVKGLKGGNVQKRNRLSEFIKKETVLCIAVLLAGISAVIVPPDAGYAGYIDFRTLAILFSLMSVMAGLQKLGVFGWIAGKLLGKVKTSRSIILILVLLCFFFSMLITNDVALITFVPFTFTVLDLLGKEQRKKMVLPVVAMQTVAANLGSMLTPIGNPQNLYLYGKAGLSVGEFLGLMLPYTALSLVLLLAWGMIQGRVSQTEAKTENFSGEKEPVWKENSVQPGEAVRPLAVYLVLFVLCLLAVAHLLPWQAVLVIVFATVFLMDRKVLAKVDYSLLLTFTGFFVFIGNMGRIAVFRDFLQRIIAGREVYTAIISSQVISNVPAALLLSGFTENYKSLIVGTNLGGLGTLIASMASLISYKYVAKEESGRKGEYIRIFTVGNICFLAVLIGLECLLS